MQYLGHLRPPSISTYHSKTEKSPQNFFPTAFFALERVFGGVAPAFLPSFGRASATGEEVAFGQTLAFLAAGAAFASFLLGRYIRDGESSSQTHNDSVYDPYTARPDSKVRQ